MNVQPDTLERLIELYTDVETAIVVPVPDDVYFQVLCACVRLKPGSEVTEQQLRAFLEDYYNDKEGVFTVLPTYYMFLTEFPLVYTGKVSRTKLMDLALRKFGKSTN